MRNLKTTTELKRFSKFHLLLHKLVFTSFSENEVSFSNNAMNFLAEESFRNLVQKV